MAIFTAGSALAGWGPSFAVLPVSYTHLDVYKRQEQKHATANNAAAASLATGFMPVSYTHLDVYKRQGVDRDADEATAGIVSTTGPYLRDPMALIVGPGSSGSRVALPRGFALAAEMERQHVGDEIAYFDTPKQCVDAVLTGAADFAYADTHVANYLLSESQYESLTVTTMTDYTNDMRCV